MHNHQDYTTTLGVGIRLMAENCRAIRKIRNEWQEFGPVDIPVDPRLLRLAPSGIAPGVLAVALSTFEKEYPGTRLRRLLQMSDAERLRKAANRPMDGQQGETAADANYFSSTPGSGPRSPFLPKRQRV
jgi:hypothetical protein